MDKADFESALKGYVNGSCGNFVSKEAALRGDLAGMKIFDDPVFGYAAADDPLFEELKEKTAVGPHFMTPAQWLGGAKSVISVFLPFSAQVREANGKDTAWPADEWLHARIEGHAFMQTICAFIADFFAKENLTALSPMTDPRFSSKSPFTQDSQRQDFYTSNWSERHVAYIAALGSFGVCGGIITEKGTAGRFLSAVSSAALESSPRPYSGIYDYCSRCGACASNCPVGAVSMERGKSHPLCSDFLEKTMAKHRPRYGCGKCQVKVPCEGKKPGGS